MFEVHPHIIELKKKETTPCVQKRLFNIKRDNVY